MKELIDLLTKNLGVNGKQAEGGAAVLFKAARDKLGASEFDGLLGGLPGLADLLKKAPAGGGLGTGLLGNLAGAALGGNAALIATVVQGFRGLDLAPDDAKKFVPVITGFLRDKVGPAAVATLERTLRA